MRTIETLIVEDEKDAQCLLRDLLLEIEDVIVVDIVGDVDTAMTSVMKHNPDLIFLDINLPRKNGFELIHELRSLDMSIPVIFTTGFDEYAVSALRHGAIDYLIKPIDRDELKVAIIRYTQSAKKDFATKMDQLLQKLNNIKVRFNNRTGYILIDPEDIMYCEAAGNYTIIYLDNETEETVSMKIKYVEELINNDDGFIRLSRTLLLNKNCVNKIDRKNRTVTLIKNNNELKIHIPRNKFRLLSDFFSVSGNYS